MRIEVNPDGLQVISDAQNGIFIQCDAGQFGLVIRRGGIELRVPDQDDQNPHPYFILHHGEESITFDDEMWLVVEEQNQKTSHADANMRRQKDAMRSPRRDYDPCDSSPVGATLQKMMIKYHMRPHHVAQRLGESKSAVLEILNGERRLSDGECLELALLFGTTTRFWFQRDVVYWTECHQEPDPS